MPLLLSGKKSVFVRPLIVLRDTVMFPSLNLPLSIGRKKSIEAVRAAQHQEYEAVIVAQKQSLTEDPSLDDIFTVGTLARIHQILQTPSGALQVPVEGKERVRIIRIVKTDPYLLADVQPIPEVIDERTETEAKKRQLLNLFQQLILAGKTMPAELAMNVFATTNTHRLVEMITIIVNPKLTDRQAVLEAEPISDRLDTVLRLLHRELEVQQLSKKIEERTQSELGKMQREVFLREQMKSIQKELGGEAGNEFADLEKKIKAAGMIQATEKHALKELDRLRTMPSFGPEISYLRTYLDWLVALPWQIRDKTAINLPTAKQTLDQDHFGLEKVKERVLEHLAVTALTTKQGLAPRAQILCFVGPPGVGKTSIGKSIAKALGRKFARVSLGGIRDEAEIRGHRRTYVGALPGRILQTIRQVGTKNPVIMLDELDKVGADFRGDPAAALLETLDPEQNREFSDHYLEVPFDLSEVFFIATANLLDTIPPALRDRLELIPFHSYTEEEKEQIAQMYLMPKVIGQHGLVTTDLRLSREAIRSLIRLYTREAGVRELERLLAQLARKRARAFAEGRRQTLTITDRTLPHLLGPAPYSFQMKEAEAQVGVVQGLAVTSAGGDVLTIEVTKVPGKGNLVITGQLGEVMKESVQAAMSYTRNRASREGIPPTIFQDHDWHVHVPAGAIPKDGPSAGIAITTALCSVASHRAVRNDVAMTGEVTLRGRVLGIGGIKEKVLAAHRAGIETVVIPKENEKDLGELPRKTRKELTIIPVDTVDEVLAIALPTER
ncbi:endopeptidase La [Candidatus Berkelbacteria bacterium]|nr:endopeptidase La [Candidatus Berkelbacteria bacterium]